MMSEDSFMIKKVMVDSRGKKTHVLLTNGQSEILEVKHENIVKNLINVLNENSDSGWTYELVRVKNEVQK
tara:strand:+ start:490 stop:699 length:210 start_codon:yes stop_codon:yes gene_type:complete